MYQIDKVFSFQRQELINYAKYSLGIDDIVMTTHFHTLFLKFKHGPYTFHPIKTEVITVKKEVTSVKAEQKITNERLTIIENKSDAIMEQVGKKRRKHH